METFNLFVYGTLMRGFSPHQRFIPQNCEMVKSQITGNLYHYPAGFPMVELFDKDGVEGTYDYFSDLKKQNDLNKTTEIKELPFDLEYGKVYGELYRIPFSEENIFRLDSYEGFNPENVTYYKRTLVPVHIDKEFVWAWVYNVKEIPKNCIRIYSGDWRDCFLNNTLTLRPEIKVKQY